MDSDLADGIKWYLVFLLSTSGHEAAHAWVAHRLGDDTADRAGQVSLNPAAHIQREPFGMVVVPLLSYFLGGWMIGWASAPYDPEWAWRHPRRSAVMALAGPAANFILVLLAVALMRVGCEWSVFQQPPHSDFLHAVTARGPADGLGGFCAKMLSLFFSLNLLLGAFNLLPLPPLDGSSVPLLFLPAGAARKYWLALRQPVFAWFGLMAAWKLFALVQPALFQTAWNLLYFVLPAR